MNESDGRPEQGNPATDDLQGDRRLDDLDARLARAAASEAHRTGTDRPEADPNYRMGSRVLADLIGGIAGGALLGWLVDRLFGTWPWGFVILLFLGVVVAFRNIFRIASGRRSQCVTPATLEFDEGFTVADAAKLDPMHQFAVQPIAHLFDIGGREVFLTNSAVWMLLTGAVLWLFMLGGMKRQLVPGRWQVAVEGFTGFISSMMTQNIGQEGRKYTPYVFSLFMFILFANILGLLPLGIVGVHPFTVTSHFTITGVLAILSFAIVLIVGFWRHGFHFFSLFVPHGTPWWLLWLIPVIELVSFMVRPFSLGLRLFVAMTAGHVLMEVFSSFIIDSLNAGPALGVAISIPTVALMVGISALELLVAGIQAYVFALLTSLYLNDAVNLH